MPEQISLEGRVKVLSYSGGKDSGATWLALREHSLEPDHILCADTGWEALEWYDHIRRFQDLMGREITTVRASVEIAEHLLPYALEVEALLGISPSPMVRRVLHKAMFPNRMQKWCTIDLKQRPCDEWVDRMDLDDAIQITGVRADESRKRALYTVDERHSVSGHWHWRPILDWSVGDVVDIHRRHGMPMCSLYDRGVSRVGCWPCMPARNKNEVSLLDDRRIAAIRRLEQIVNHLSAERRAKQGLGPTGAIAFQLSDFDGIPDIDTAVAHAKTYRGGHRDQGRLFEPVKLDTCQRWGVCDSGGDGFSC
jgi:3'-phosphoadenosine 5'-phosphosulfate sulfotransferase (PAPS reductase)/FAD synthetase